MASDTLFVLFIFVVLLFAAKVVTIFRIPKLFPEKLSYQIKRGHVVMTCPLFYYTVKE